MIELTTQDGAYIYRIARDDGRVVQRRENKHGARWLFWAKYATEAEARQALLEIVRTQD